MQLRPRLLSLAFLLLSARPAVSQTSSPASEKQVDEGRRVTLHGTVHALAQPQYDRGAVADDFAANRMLLLLNRSADREAALQRFLREVHTAGSAHYHQWLTPEEFGARFGANEEDIQSVTAWLRSHGFAVPRVSKSRGFLEFSGSAAQVREALHAQIHQYFVNGETNYSISSEATIPEALAGVIRGFAPLGNFELASYAHAVGPAKYSRASRQVTPEFTTTLNSQPFYALAPEDFATQYNLGPVYKAGTDGTGQTIGVIGGANIDLGLVDAYRKLFGLPADHTQVVIDGEDPGPQLGSNVEGFLDVEVSGAVAPKATINFYIAGGTHFQSLITLAAVRAVEDNQASVLSASFGECEQLLGQTGNQFWGSLWEQAAAQGQTVLVSSGDSGPATCPLGVILPGGTEVTFGLSVNGLSSTPWNVSVGGTDFFYSDYVSGAPSAATLWNQTNDSSLGSLKAPLPEQPWDDQFGFNAIPTSTTSFSIPSAAGGGGPSSCANSTASPPAPPVCVSGYPKPSWQNAPGVPNDGVRDLPDVSLFAANGRNFSAYPICANPGDCASVATGEPQILLVGGTSASAPAMAGIMALVNQKTGSRQGQADFTLYALARQQASVFHDITMGANDTLCIVGNKDCSIALPNNTTIGRYGVYPAGAGYDFATGLGSVDANALITNWSSITLQPTSTTLQLTPSTVMHGSPVSVTAAVQATSGSAVPTGDVDLATTSSTPILHSGVLSLSNGSASSSLSFFPGGTYQVTAQYAGDGVFAGSSSSPVTLTVTPEPSSTSLNLQYLYIDWSASPIVSHSGTVPSGGQIPYSSEWTLEAQPSGQSSQSLGLATGTATFADGATSVPVPLNSRGIAAWSPQSLSVGSHSVTVNYSGDASYAASVAGPLTFTVTKGIARLSASPVEGPVGFVSGTAGTYLAGSNLDVAINIGSLASGVPPSGMVTVSLGSLTQTATLAPFTQAFRSNSSTAVATFSNVPEGTYTLSASYGGDNNWNSATFTSPLALTFAAATVVSTTTTLTASSSSISTKDSVTLTAVVQPAQGSSVVGEVEITANGASVAFALVGAIGLSPPTNTVTVALSGARLPVGSVQLRAIFRGSAGLAPSLSPPVSLTVTPADFGMSIGASRLTVKSGQSASVPLLLTGPNGGGVSVSLACLPSSSSIGCVINTSSLTVNQNMTEQVTINAFVPATTASNFPARENRRTGFFAISASFASVFGFLWVLPGRKRRTNALRAVAFFGVAGFVLGCGGGSSSPPPPNVNAPPGTYTVVVTGTSNGVVHNAKLTVIVQ